MTLTRRSVLGTLAAASGVAAKAQKPPQQNWKPKLGLLARYSEANIEFARQEGFTSLQLSGIGGKKQDDAELEKIKAVIQRSGLYVSSLLEVQNHIAPEPAARAKGNERFIEVLEACGKLGVAGVGTSSGNMPGRPLKEQVDEIVRVYTEKYFPVCQKYNVKILWEPWAGGPNIATGPVGYEALFKAFGDTPYIGLQYDPSHLEWQMMDPVQCARDYVGKIHDVHLKDTEIFWPVLRRVGIQPLDNTKWWRFRLPGSGSIKWEQLFAVLKEAGFQGALNIEHEDDTYYPLYQGKSPDFTEKGKEGFRIAHRFLKQFIPA
jgi:sugar phosphate isomerase/epimerase